ncbi:hypothetical protein LV75_002666 [Actinokineospora diospyrosa]|uniref:Uncharacterized protein n=1 Tax=Actinokineospora diospyrosa TaxID=103728 RepID=A0ABT1IC03_9PSEU|nr:hypothetical protein [Actinokineospora diospyrosa]
MSTGPRQVRPNPLGRPWTPGPNGANPPPVMSAPTHLPSAWLLGTAGVIPARSRQPCQPSAWTLGPGGANWPSVRSASAHFLSTWTVGVAGAKCSMGWTCFVWGDGTRSVSARQGQSFGPLLCGSASGVVGAPHKTGPPHRAFTHCRGSGAEVAARRRGRPIPGRDAGGEPTRRHRTPSPAPPTTAYAKINLIESPQIHSLPRSTDTPAAANDALWTTEDVVDNHAHNNHSQREL